jgi:hypothetical protein
MLNSYEDVGDNLTYKDREPMWRTEEIKLLVTDQDKSK